MVKFVQAASLVPFSGESQKCIVPTLDEFKAMSPKEQLFTMNSFCEHIQNFSSSHIESILGLVSYALAEGDGTQAVAMKTLFDFCSYHRQLTEVVLSRAMESLELMPEVSSSDYLYFGAIFAKMLFLNPSLAPKVQKIADSFQSLESEVARKVGASLHKKLHSVGYSVPYIS